MRAAGRAAAFRILCIVSLVAALAAVAAPPRAYAQVAAPPAPQEVETDSDPTRPIFVSIRPEFYALSDGVEQRVLIARYDASVLRTMRLFHGRPGAVLRLEAPFVSTNVPGDDAAGLGDVYGQFVVMPYATPTFVWAFGSGFTLPTATNVLTGGGKWAVAPVGAPVWRLPRGLFFVKVQNFTSIAGDGSRPDLNYLLVTPTFIHAVKREWWVLADSESRSTWTDDGRTGIKSGLQLGRRIGTGVGLWVKPEVWWGPNRDGRWNLKFGLVWYERRPQSAVQQRQE